MARILIEKADGGDCLRLRAIVVRPSSSPRDLAKRASLLRRDSVHGAFDGTIRVDEEAQVHPTEESIVPNVGYVSEAAKIYGDRIQFLVDRADKTAIEIAKVRKQIREIDEKGTTTRRFEVRWQNGKITEEWISYLEVFE